MCYCQLYFADIYEFPGTYFPTMIVFATTITPRLLHAVDWLGNYLFGKPLSIITNESELPENDSILNYSAIILPVSCFQVQPHTLLFETGIRQQEIEIKHHQNQPYFFSTAGDFHFDIVAASFYLMQRYEEYEPHRKDDYGRYAPVNSLAYKHHFLHLPLVDLWMQNFKTALQSTFKEHHLPFIERKFQFTPTYDVDIAYDKLGKGWLRNLAGLYRSLYKRKLPQLVQQFSINAAEKKDLFDIFDELHALHTTYSLRPVYFFLMAQQQKGVDKNINPAKKIYRQLIQTIAADYQTGIHLSAASYGSVATMLAEKNLLAHISQHPIIANRNHYLLFNLPKTYEALQKSPLLIREEYSMGYSTTNGFRASTCSPYYWYNVETDQSTTLQIFPFCYMEATSIFHLRHTPQQALEALRQFHEIVKGVNGQLITIFHNHLIGRHTDGRQWMEIYRQFLSEVQ